MQKKKRNFKKHLLILLTLIVTLAMPVTAHAASKKVSLKVSGGTVYVGASKSLGAKYTKGAKVSFTSSNKAVVSVNSKGVVTGKKAGTAKVTVTAKKSKYATAKKVVTVKVVKRNNSITASNKSIQVGKAVSLGAKAKGGSLSYKSSNTKVATVNSKGTITGKKAGTAKITISTKGNGTYKSASKTVTVKVSKHSHKYVKKVTPAVTKKVEHKEEGYWKEPEWVIDEPAHEEIVPAYTVFQCDCSSQFLTLEELLEHQKIRESQKSIHDSYEECVVPGWTINHPEEGYWTERQWIVDSPAYTEDVVTQHFVCTACGADFTSEGAMADHGYSILDQSIMEGREPDQSHMGYSSYNTTETINHPEEGHWEEPQYIVTQEAYDEVIPDCHFLGCACGEDFGTYEEYLEHRNGYEDSCKTYKEVEIPEETILRPEKNHWTEREWVVTKEAYTEEVVVTPAKTEYVCSCGAKK